MAACQTGGRPCPLGSVPGLWLLMVAALAMLAGCGPLEERASGGELFDPVPAGAVRVATFNLRYDNPGDGENRWERRRKAVARVVAESGAAVVGTQEGLAHQVAWLDSALTGYAYVGVGRDDGAEAGEFTAIFIDTARYRIGASGTFWLSTTPDRPSVGWDAAMERICTWAVLEAVAGGKDEPEKERGSGENGSGENPSMDGVSRILVLNAHFDHIGETARLESARLLVRRMEDLAIQWGSEREDDAREPMPVIVLGDFNARPESLPIAALTDRLRDAHDTSQSPPTGPDGTFNGFEPRDRYEGRIDYVMHSADLKALTHTTLGARFDGRFPSDHFPVVVDLAPGRR